MLNAAAPAAASPQPSPYARNKAGAAPARLRAVAAVRLPASKVAAFCRARLPFPALAGGLYLPPLRTKQLRRVPLCRAQAPLEFGSVPPGGRPPGEGGGKGDGDGGERWWRGAPPHFFRVLCGWLKRHWALTFGISFLCLSGPAFTLFRHSKVLAVVSKGNVRLSDEDRKRVVQRTAEQASLVELLKATGLFLTVVGPKGAGKTTLVHMACDALGSGVIHVLVPSPNEEGEVEPAFRRLLADAIDFIPPLSSYRPPPLGSVTLDDVLGALSKAAASFAAREGRPAVLVIDGADFLADNEALVKKLVGQAKTWSDMDNVRVVFVASDGLFVTKMREFSKNHRSREVVVLGPSKEEAEAIISRRGLFTQQSAEVVGELSDLLGDSVDHLITLNSRAAEIQSVADVHREVVRLVGPLFENAGLRDDNRSSPDYRTKFNALSALAAAGASGIPRAEFVQLLGSAKLLAELNQAGLINLPDRVSNVRFHSRGARWFAERALLPP